MKRPCNDRQNRIKTSHDPLSRPKNRFAPPLGPYRKSMGDSSDSEENTVYTESSSSGIVAVYSDKEQDHSPLPGGPEIALADTAETQKDLEPSFPGEKSDKFPDPQINPETQTTDKTDDILDQEKKTRETDGDREKVSEKKKSKDKEKAAESPEKKRYKQKEQEKEKTKEQEKEKKRGRSTEKKKKYHSTRVNRPNERTVPVLPVGAIKYRPLLGTKNHKDRRSRIRNQQRKSRKRRPNTRRR